MNFFKRKAISPKKVPGPSLNKEKIYFYFEKENIKISGVYQVAYSSTEPIQNVNQYQY